MVRFLADASLRHAIVTGCVRREPAIDFLSPHAAKLQGISDRDVLEIAAAQGRILVTQDFRTMPKHFAEFLSTGRSSRRIAVTVNNIEVDVTNMTEEQFLTLF